MRGRVFDLDTAAAVHAAAVVPAAPRQPDLAVLPGPAGRAQADIAAAAALPAPVSFVNALPVMLARCRPAGALGTGRRWLRTGRRLPLAAAAAAAAAERTDSWAWRRRSRRAAPAFLAATVA